MQHAVFDAGSRSEIERARQLLGRPQRIGDRQRSVLADDGVERLGRDKFLGQIRAGFYDAGGNRRRDRRMRQARRDNRFEFGDQLVDALGRQVESEQFDGDQSLAFGIERPKDGTQCASADLMKNPERTEGVWKRSTGSFRVQ